MPKSRWSLLFLLLLVPALIAATAMVVNNNDTPVSDDGSGPPPATKPSETRGVVAGTVTTRDGEPVPDAAVLPTSLEEPPRLVPDLGVLTGPDGQYEWRLRPGRYSLAVHVNGEVLESLTTTVVAGQTVTLDFSLR